MNATSNNPKTNPIPSKSFQQDMPYMKFAKYLAGYDPKKPLSPKQESDMWSCMMNAVIGIAMLVLASALVYIASTDPAAASNRMYVYSVLIVVPIIVAAYMMVPSVGSKPSGTRLMGYSIFVCALFIVSYNLMKNMSMKEIVYANYFIMFLLVCFAAFTVVILSKVSTRYLMSLEGWTGFVAKLTLYLPCLIYELVTGSIEMMPNIYAKIALILVYVSLFLTVLYKILILFVDSSDLFPQWLKDIAYQKSLMKMETLPLNVMNKQDVTGLDANDLILNATYENGTALNDGTRVKNYTISAWVYVPAVCQPTRIIALRRASDEDTKTKGSPSVIYNSNGKMQIVFSRPADPADSNPPKTPTPTQKIIDIAPQKWNHLVFVYEDQVAHFYLNSKLLFSEPLNMALPEYTFSDELVTGEDGNMIEGGKISGASYVPTTYTAQQIVGIYENTRRFYM